jgi:malate dehydrogenase
MIPCAASLEGEYGMDDIMIGVPVIIGKNGIEKVVELDLNDDEKALLAASEAAVRKTNAILTEMNLI